MKPRQLRRLREWTRTKEGKRLTQKLAAERLGIGQSALSRAEDEDGDLTLATETVGRYIELLTPYVLFISGNARDAGLIASAYIVSGEQKIITETPEGFAELLKMGLDIVVLTDNKEPYLTLIKQALAESGLPSIPTKGLKIDDMGQVAGWND